MSRLLVTHTDILFRKITVYAQPLRVTGTYVFLSYVKCVMGLPCFSLFLDKESRDNYEGRTESHEQLFFACELGTADEGDGGV